MESYQGRFKSCGQNVFVAPDAYIEHPERMEVGDNVSFMKGFHMIEGPRVCRIGSNASFHPNCFIQGTADRLIIADHVDFYLGTYLSLGDEHGFVEIGHHTHFAPGCVLYGHGGLTIGPYCNIAAHTVFATVGHDPARRELPMALAPARRADHVGGGRLDRRERDDHRQYDRRPRLCHRRQRGADT